MSKRPLTIVKNGDRVRDKFKVPRPGDESTEGTVIAATTRSVTVQMDTVSSAFENPLRKVNRRAFRAMFDLIPEKAETT